MIEAEFILRRFFNFTENECNNRDLDDIKTFIGLFFDYEVQSEILGYKMGSSQNNIKIDKADLRGYSEYYNRKRRKIKEWRKKKK